MRIHLSLIPQEIRDKYKVTKFVEDDGYVYVEITGAMHQLSPSSQIADKIYKNILQNIDTTQLREYQDYGSTKQDQSALPLLSTTLA